MGLSSSSRTTLATWAKEGKIRAIRHGEGHNSGLRYNEDLRIHLGIKDSPGGSYQRLTIRYAHAASPKLKTNRTPQARISEPRQNHHRRRFRPQLQTQRASLPFGPY